MNKLKIESYNLEHTLMGGQAFNWDKIDGIYYGFFRDKVLKIEEVSESEISWQTFPKKDDLEFVKKYLNLDPLYSDSIKELSKKDIHIKKAVEKYKGLRILNQDFEQCLLSFILSSHKSVKGVRKSVRDLANKYGQKLNVDGIEFSLFPRAEDLSELSESDFRKLGFGFRSAYFTKAIKKLTDKSSAPNLSDESEARKYLVSFAGIGEKISECIMVFSLGFKNITPLDIWGKRVFINYYGLDSKASYAEIRNWYQNYFGENSAIAGQYLFEYIRHD